MAWGNAPEKDFGKWREQAREKLLECIQPAPPVAPYDMKVIATEKRKGYEAQKIVFNVSEYSRVPAYLIMEHILLLEKKKWYVRLEFQKL